MAQAKIETLRAAGMSCVVGAAAATLLMVQEQAG